MSKLILASSSPRRKNILKMVKLNFEVVPSNVSENYEKKLNPKQVVEKLSQKKAMAVCNKFPNAYVIGADTIVYVKNKILNKPKNKNEAFKMLKFLSNTQHMVLTGVCLINEKDKIVFNFIESTKVYFYKLDEELILNYIKTSSPYDKSGSYAIQDYSACFVKKIEGCYYNVVGFPISKFLNTLRTFPQIKSILT